MNGKYINTALPTDIILKECGEDPSKCTFFVGGISINDTVFDAECKRPLPDPIEIEQSGWNETRKIPRNTICVVHCGLCSNNGVERG